MLILPFRNRTFIVDSYDKIWVILLPVFKFSSLFRRLKPDARTAAILFNEFNAGTFHFRRWVAELFVSFLKLRHETSQTLRLVGISAEVWSIDKAPLATSPIDVVIGGFRPVEDNFTIAERITRFSHF